MPSTQNASSGTGVPMCYYRTRRIARGDTPVWFAGIIAVLLLVTAGAAYRTVAARVLGKDLAPVRLPVPLARLPMEVDGWRGQDLPIEETTLEYMRQELRGRLRQPPLCPCGPVVVGGSLRGVLLVEARGDPRPPAGGVLPGQRLDCGWHGGVGDYLAVGASHKLPDPSFPPACPVRSGDRGVELLRPKRADHPE